MVANACIRARAGGYDSAMTPDEELMVIFGALHVIALALGVVLFMMFLRSDSTSSWNPPEDDEGGGGGGNDRLPSRPKPKPTGGVPLPDADPARARLRGPGKLRDAHPRPLRRPAHPAVPRRRPVRQD
jgi:hypothetical protein